MENLPSDDLMNLPTDSNEPLAHMDVGQLQKILKKPNSSKKQSSPTVEVNSSAIRSHLVRSNLVRDLKTVLLAMVLYLVLSHPKIDSMLAAISKDIVILYTVKGAIFSVLLFVLIHRLC